MTSPENNLIFFYLKPNRNLSNITGPGPLCSIFYFIIFVRNFISFLCDFEITFFPLKV